MSAAAGATASARGDSAAVSGTGDADWLHVGASFVPKPRDAARVSLRDDSDSDVEETSALQVYRGKRSSSSAHKKSTRKSRKYKDKHKHKRRHKSSSSRRRRRSEYSSGSERSSSSDDDSNASERDADSRQLTKRSRSSKHERRRDRRRDRNHSSDSSSSGRRRHRHREPKRLRAVDGDSAYSASLIASAPREVRAWLQPPTAAVDTRDASGIALFEFDCAGDRDNALFGSLYAHDTPLYTLATRRNVFTGAWLVDRRKRGAASTTTATATTTERSNDARYFGASARLMERDAQQQRLYLAYSQKRLGRERERIRTATHQSQPASSQAAATEMAFIPLDPSPELITTDTSGDADHDLVLRTETANIEAYVVARSRALNAALQQRPHDVAQWLDLVAFQEQSARLVRSRGRNSSSDIAAAMVADKQSAILDRAVAANPASRELQLVQLNFLMRHRVGTGSGSSATAPLDSDALKQQLEAMIERDPSNAALWSKLLELQLQHFASFSVPSARELYARVLAVLHKEVVKVVTHDVIADDASHRESSNSVQIYGAGSLLATAPRSLHHVLASSHRARELVVLMLRFHARLCRLEHKAGYTERSVALLQALLEFNAVSDSTVAQVQKALHSGSGSSESVVLQALERLRSDLQQQFAMRWEQPDAPHFGDDWPASAVGDAGSAYMPSASVFERLVHEQLVTHASAVNPPEIIQSAQHRAQLERLAGDANCKRVREAPESRDDAVRDDASGSSDERSPCQQHTQTQRQRLVYSNVHGRRIAVDDIDDASEYERILSELRGHEASVARHDARASKSAKQRAAAAQALARCHDERIDYAAVDVERDAFFQWLQLEEVKDVTQWVPLHASNAMHAALIDDQPDRAVLTDELQPFVFQVPRAMRLRVVLQLLEFAGVRLCQRRSWGRTNSVDTIDDDDDNDDDEAVYADCLDEFGDLVAPIVRAMDASSAESLLMSPQQRRDRLERELLDDVCVTPAALADPSKVAFVRNVLQRYVSILNAEHDRDGAQVVKCLWIAYEAQLVCNSSADNRDAAAASARTFCQQLMASSLTPDALPPSAMDIALLVAYAKLELRTGNVRQVARVCDRTLASLALPTASDAKMDRSFHALLFLRARSEMWHVTPSAVTSQSVSPSSHALRRFKTLYVLWSCWQRDCEPLERLEKTHRKSSSALRRHLESVLSPAVQAAIVEKYRVELEIAVQQQFKTQQQHQTATAYASTSTSAMTHDIELWRVGYCAHNLCLVVYASADLSASCREYEALLDDLTSASSTLHVTHHQRRWLHLCWLECMQQHAASGAFPTVAPRVWRRAVSAAVASAPHDALLLRLFVDAETSNIVSQSLRLHLDAVRKRAQRRFDSPLLVEWLFALLCEFSRLERAAIVSAASAGVSSLSSSSSPPSPATCCVLHKFESNIVGLERVRRVFHDMVESSRTQGSALGWRLLLRFEVAVGKIERARRAFYRGVAKCPWSKALFVDGVRVLRPYLSAHECAELLEFMAAKELHVREDM